MFGTRWYKVFNDLWGNKTRTVLIVLSIAVGLFAVGTIISSREILFTEMDNSYAAIVPSSGTVRTVELFDESFVRSFAAMDHVMAVDARRVIMARIQVGPDTWSNITLFAVADYDNMQVNKVRPQEGAWPPPEREILIERAALLVIQAEIGDVVLIETEDEKRRAMRISGTTHDLAQLPAQFDSSPYGYISFDTLDWLGEPYGFNELHIAAANAGDKEFAQQVINEVKSKAERSGFTIPLTLTADPGQLPLDDILQAILLLMGTLGTLSLFLSAFLIINTISALLAQQKRQIGVMKAIGAHTGQIMGMYLAMVLFYGVMALIIAGPLSVVGARTLSRFIASMFNFDLGLLKVSLSTVVLQIAVGIFVPLFASVFPLASNLRITAAEAMSVYRMGKGNLGKGVLDRLLSGANLWFARHVLSRPVLLSVRNTFRSKGRLVLTLITLTMASAIFVSVFSVRDSLFRTVDDLLLMWNFDTMIVFSRPYRVDKIEEVAARLPEVESVDTWIQVPCRRIRSDGSEGGLVYMFAPRADSELAQSPLIVAGRWLLPGDENAIVVSTNMLQDEPDIQLGDEIVLKIQGQERSWRVVGISMGFLFPMTYANYPYVARTTGRAGRADTALIATRNHDPDYVTQATASLEMHFKRNGFRVNSVQTVAEERGDADVAYGIVITLLLIMAVLLAVVGGLGLMGTMSINVLERTREIGVLRAIGAPNRGVFKVFIREGITIGLLSWLLGSLLSYPLSRMLSTAVGIPLSGAPLSFTFSVTGVWLWLIIVVLLSGLASFLPARNASRLTVREVLAYE
ncbi:MAG: ABC transporter permease [Anaerolineae bacterium]|nr:ABC transporter permease [Anaerolineae bacterium]